MSLYLCQCCHGRCMRVCDCVSPANTYLSFRSENPHGKSFGKSLSLSLSCSTPLLLLQPSWAMPPSSSSSSTSSSARFEVYLFHFFLPFCPYYCFVAKENWKCLRDQLSKRGCLAQVAHLSAVCWMYKFVSTFLVFAYVCTTGYWLVCCAAHSVYFLVKLPS